MRPDFFQGMRIIQSPYLTQEGPPETVRRSWRARLLTWPWRPWVATYTYRPQVPYEGAVQINFNTLVMHPATYKKMVTMLHNSN